MARLYDRIMAGDIYSKQASYMEPIVSAMRTAAVVQIDNVAEYFERQKGSSKFMPTDDGWKAVPTDNVWRMSDFPNVAPPFPVAWYEHRMTFGPHRIEFGVLRASYLVSEGDTVNPCDAFPDVAKPDMDYSVRFPDGGWMVCATLFEKQTKRHAVVVAGDWLYGVHADGKPWAKGGDTFTVKRVAKEYRDLYREVVPDDFVFTKLVSENMTRQCLYPSLLADSFMHCKNVVSRQVAQPPALSKKWEKKHGRPLVRYHVLDIDPMKKVLRDEGGSEETGLKKALHICRGHFATYTEDAPLFGRQTGTFWKPQHIRGSAAEGIVVKDYNVKAPRGAHHA